LISATLLQWGPWDPRYEAEYQRLYREARPFLEGDWPTRLAALAANSPGVWIKVLNDFNRFRISRLTAYLRKGAAAGTVNGSVLIYRVSAEDLRRAFDGPPPESVPDPRNLE
jgi:hypothetical protein